MRRSRKLPFASAGGEPDLTFSEADWQRIEQAYREPLSADVRSSVVEATQKFVYWEGFERKAEPVAKAQEFIAAYKRAAMGLQQAMSTGGSSDARTSARYLVMKHFQDPRLSDKAGSSYVGRFHTLTGVLTSFQSACIIALRELEPPPSTRGLLGDLGALPSFRDGEGWALWIRRLTEIADDNALPHGVRKDAGNKSRSDKQSPFTLFVWELQKCLPKECKCPTQSKSALAKAIGKARRVDVSIANLLWRAKRAKSRD